MFGEFLAPRFLTWIKPWHRSSLSQVRIDVGLDPMSAANRACDGQARLLPQAYDRTQVYRALALGEIAGFREMERGTVVKLLLSFGT